MTNLRRPQRSPFLNKNVIFVSTETEGKQQKSHRPLGASARNSRCPRSWGVSVSETAPAEDRRCFSSKSGRFNVFPVKWEMPGLFLLYTLKQFHSESHFPGNGQKMELTSRSSVSPRGAGGGLGGDSGAPHLASLYLFMIPRDNAPPTSAAAFITSCWSAGPQCIYNFYCYIF